MKPITFVCALFILALFVTAPRDASAVHEPMQKPENPRAEAEQQTRPQAEAKSTPPNQLTQSSSQLPAPPPSPAPQPVSTTPAQRGDYVIGPSDVLTVNVWKDQALSGTLLVRPDGMISMPLLGDVPAKDLTALQLADQITGRLKKYIQSPNVTVVITQIHSKVVYMFGEVARKGPIEMTSSMTVLEAISAAGGLTDFANKRKIYILRNHQDQRITIPVHYKEALKGGKEWDVVLQADDRIVVP